MAAKYKTFDDLGFSDGADGHRLWETATTFFDNGYGVWVQFNPFSNYRGLRTYWFSVAQKSRVSESPFGPFRFPEHDGAIPEDDPVYAELAIPRRVLIDTDITDLMRQVQDLPDA